MEQSLWMQGRQFLQALLLGLALGIHYDLLRGLRRNAKWLTHLLDLWFVLTYLAGNLLFALYAGKGQFRIFAFFGSLLGAAAYFLTLSRLVLPAFRKIWYILLYPLGMLGRFLGKIFGKSKKIAKNIFSSRKKSVTIKRRVHSHQRKNPLGGTSNAPAQIVTHYKAADPGHRSLRHSNHRGTAAADQ